MKHFYFSERSRLNLLGVHPDLVLVAGRALWLSNIDFGVTSGVRSPAQQKKLVAQGVSWTLDSKHLVQPDGFGHAIDVMALGDLNGDGTVDQFDKLRTWDPEVYKQIAGAFFKAASVLKIEIRWGGHFEKRFDGPHFELVR